MNPNQRRTGFTLIELLTVIAIIGILAAILIPVVGRVRESARGARCVSNLRQIGQGIHLYAEAHGGNAPAGQDNERHERRSGTGGTGFWSTFHGGIWPYVFEEPTGTADIANIRNNASEPNVFQCPTLYGAYPTAASAPAELFYSGEASDSSTNYSYALNHLAAPDRSVYNTVNLDSLTMATQTVAVVECYMWHMSGTRYSLFGVLPHGGGGNFLFFDGHVERRNRNEIPSPDDQQAVFWNGDNAT